jgi:hypothetical protein
MFKLRPESFRPVLQILHEPLKVRIPDNEV